MFVASTFMVFGEILCAILAYYNLIFEDKYERIFLTISSLVTVISATQSNYKHTNYTSVAG